MRIRLITDGKAGDIVQARGVAGWIATLRPAEIEESIVAPRWLYSLLMPWGPADPRDSAALRGPLPDIAIATGRRAVPALKALRRRAPHVFTAFLKDPRTGAGTADFIWVPEHDRLRGANVFVTRTGPHGLTPEKLAAARTAGRGRFPDRGRSRLLLLLGGPAGSVVYGEGLAKSLAERMREAQGNGFDVFILSSRRTPPAFTAALRQALDGLDIFIWDGGAANPYLELLALADTIVAPPDSHNMVGEALAAGVPVLIFQPEGSRGSGSKLGRFIAALVEAGQVSILDRPLSPAASASCRPIDATPEIAGRLLAAYDAFRAKR